MYHWTFKTATWQGRVGTVIVLCNAESSLLRSKFEFKANECRSPNSAPGMEHCRALRLGSWSQDPKLRTHAAPAGRQPSQPWPGRQRLTQRGHSRCACVAGTACQTLGSPRPACGKEPTVMDMEWWACLRLITPSCPRLLNKRIAGNLMLGGRRKANVSDKLITPLMQVRLSDPDLFRLRFSNKTKSMELREMCFLINQSFFAIGHPELCYSLWNIV